ncbi:methyltransferase domain-containing protein [Butyrivibrio fibrisolvens]|uniref:methyltransferase domain-containing protein n=1 Tax=Butyrivibrio fibrisolvens TaxID=831 RepID=UPI0003FE01F4|nr:methyltransferase domain-containing protein [Butyrivibrio fibrisolvens]
MSLVKEELKHLLNEGNTSEAYALLNKKISSELSVMKADSEYCIIAASIFMETEKLDAAFDIITMGLINDNRNYELYVLLGEYYSFFSQEQALLCFKQARFYCKDAVDSSAIREYVKDYEDRGIKITPITFVVDAGEDREAIGRCVSSIRDTVSKDVYNNIIVDVCINNGISSAENNTDICILNSKVTLVENSLFYLMLAMYSDRTMGVVGGLSNSSGLFYNEQKVDIEIESKENLASLVHELNSPMKNAYERKVFVSKGAMLISRKVLDDIGVFDEKLQGVYEDIDFCVRTNLAGYGVTLAYNCFVLNSGSIDCHQGEKNITESRKYLQEKWEVDLTYSSEVRKEIIEMIHRDITESFGVLELGCALGSTLNRIKFSWPNSNVHGVEYVDGAARIAGSIIDVIQGDVENMDIPYSEGQFDYIICADVLEHLRNPEETIKRFLPYLKDNGYFIISVPNVRYYAVLMMLMQYGRFDYADSGILDRTHLRFFTQATAREMLEKCGLDILEIKKNYNGNDQDDEFVNRLKENFEVDDIDGLKVFQYFFLAKRKKKFDTLVVITPKDFERLTRLYPRLIKNIGCGQIMFVGANGIKDIIADKRITGADYIDEDTIIPFNSVHACIENKMKSILAGRELPRGVTGWYYQQFLKMQYSFQCPDEYYMVWDGDTIPCKKIHMFQEDSGKPFFDLKHECHEEYFETMGIILPGFGKVIKKSFISEHMMFKTKYMKELIREIEANKNIPGKKFWEKIINAIPADKIQSSAFSEFETYGTYVALKHSSDYALREWHSFRLGGSFFDINTISDGDFDWLSKDFDAISFEKGHTVREDNANLFDNPYYQERLTPKQMLQAAQMEFKEGYKEVWDDDPDASESNVSSGEFVGVADTFIPGDRLQYLDKNTYRIYEELGDDLIEKNMNQAYLCYENAEYLCADDEIRRSLSKKKMQLLDSGEVLVRRTAFIILSYNSIYIMQRCLESIYTNCNPESYLLIVFDNGSTDGVAEWLAHFGEEHDEAYIILNDENLGFSGGCNAAYAYVPDGYDPLFINNDVRVPANALFWLRMALYENDDVGGVGAMQNYMPVTKSELVRFSAIEQYMEYGASQNVPMANPYEEQSMLCGFAMLFKRDVYDRTDGFDENFNPGYLEDDDISLQIRNMGYKLFLVHNSFIYHAGTQSFRERDDLNKLFNEHRKLIVNKWSFDSRIAGSISDNEMDFIESIKEKGYERESSFSVLHIGCGCACMLGHIHYLYPNAIVIGVEHDDVIRKFTITCIPVYKTTDELPKKIDEFDFVVENLG